MYAIEVVDFACEAIETKKGMDEGDPFRKVIKVDVAGKFSEGVPLHLADEGDVRQHRPIWSTSSSTHLPRGDRLPELVRLLAETA
ncbi:hypothetical protein ACIBCU_37925 [Streptomyces sp. NPDC051064]|uniref:hypothetical protein n=1 Tax=Streptomyces sp. NPDC051064 TaxID=3365641 RepID=UPI0037A4E7EF